MMKMWLYPTIRVPMRFVSKILFRLKVLHSKRIPEDSGYIIAMNHSSYFDHFHIISHEKRMVRFLANEKLFSNFFLNWFFSNMGHIKVDRKKKKNTKAIKKAVSILKNGGVIGIYPEGTTRKPGDPGYLEGHTGVARIALLSRVPVLPSGIAGNTDALGRKKKIPLPQKQVLVIGKPVTFEEWYDRDNDRKVLRKITDEIMSKIHKSVEEGEKMLRKY